MNEHEHQCALFRWAAMREAKYPELALLYAIPMGGKRNRRVGAYLKAEGAKKGMLDICFPVARDGHHGLYIEMKVGNNKPTKHQQWWIERLREQNYRVVVCYDWVIARDVILAYLLGYELEEEVL